jgi:putative Mn2+ efflux pump MntP
VDSALFFSIALTGFGIALAHASLPTHWLPFVVTGKMQNWTRSKTLKILAMAGFFHILVTTLLGAVIVFFGIELQKFMGSTLPYLAGGLLILMGLRHLFQPKTSCKQHFCHPVTPTTKAQNLSSSDSKFIWPLLGMLTFSPCETFLPVYLSGLTFGWPAFFILSLVLAVATLGGMLGLAWFSSFAIDKIKVDLVEKNDRQVYGILFCLFGALLIISEAGH